MKKMRKKGMNGSGSKKSPTGPCRCTQDALEPLLLAAARDRGVDARFSTELQHFEQDAQGVTATTTDRTTGAQQRIRAEYMIAADGARSPVRTQLNATQSGRGGLTHQLNLYFRAELTALVKGREFSLCLVENSALRGMVVSINNTDLWVLHVSYYPEKGERPEDFPAPRCVELIRKAIGIPELPVELLGALPWQSAVRVADRYQHGRVFLAGDAAHVMPPWGGFGANTGIQDAHNLAWKLAAVLSGHAGAALLSTYDAERQTVAVKVAEISGSMNDERGLMSVKPGLGTLQMLWNMRRVFPYLIMGYGYSSAAVALEPGPRPGPGTTELVGRPGTRAPHVWLTKAGKRISTLDLFGRGFVLFTGPKGQPWVAAARRAALPIGITIDSICVGSDVEDRAGRWLRAYGVNAEGAVLVRPDGIVAWRAKGKITDPEATLTKTLAQIMARP